jgi:hypothetical protein
LFGKCNTEIAKQHPPDPEAAGEFCQTTSEMARQEMSQEIKNPRIVIRGLDRLPPLDFHKSIFYHEAL